MRAICGRFGEEAFMTCLRLLAYSKLKNLWPVGGLNQVARHISAHLETCAGMPEWVNGFIRTLHIPAHYQDQRRSGRHNESPSINKVSWRTSISAQILEKSQYRLNVSEVR